MVSLAVLADRHPNFRPQRFEMARWGFRCLFEFPTVKLLDYRERWEELEKDENPFAVVVMAHLKEQERRRGEDESLLRWKIRMVKMLYERGYSRHDVLLLYRFIDGLIRLPEELGKRFHQEIIKYEEERKMPYVTTAERIGIEKGIQQGIQQGILIGEERGKQAGIQQGIQQGILIGEERGEQKGLKKGIREGLLEAIELGLLLKFQGQGLALYPEISKIEDIGVLRAIVEALKVSDRVEDIVALYSPPTGARAA